MYTSINDMVGVVPLKLYEKSLSCGLTSMGYHPFIDSIVKLFNDPEESYPQVTVNLTLL